MANTKKKTKRATASKPTKKATASKPVGVEGTRFALSGRALVPELDGDAYLGPKLVATVKAHLARLVRFLEEAPRTSDEVQRECDAITEALNAHEDELETVARDAIATTVQAAFEVYGIGLGVEDALRNRAW